MSNNKKKFIVASLVTLFAVFSQLAAYAFDLPKSMKDLMGGDNGTEQRSSETVDQGQDQQSQPAEGTAEPQEQQKSAAKPVAENRPEVPVYPGAKSEPSVNKMMKQSMKLDAACYRTNDGVQKVSEFYKKQKGLDFSGAEKEVAGFKRCKKQYNEYLKKEMSVGCDRDITVQNPWQDMESGKLIHDTLICIVNTSVEH